MNIFYNIYRHTHTHKTIHNAIYLYIYTIDKINIFKKITNDDEHDVVDY